MHLSQLGEQIELQQKLCDRLEAIAARIRSTDEVSGEELVQETMEVISMSERFEKYYITEQLEELKERRRVLSKKGICQAEGEWPELIEQVRDEMYDTDPASESA